MKLAPSLLSADFAKLHDEAASVEALVDRFHWDVMDGHFVPNLTFGPPVVNALRNRLRLPFDIHLMIEKPATYAPQFVVRSDDTITFHLESEDPADAVIETIREIGCRVGVSLRPKEALDRLAPHLSRVDHVLVMSVEPGFGGQSFLPGSLDRIRTLREMIGELDVEIAVDGGIHAGNVGEVVSAGADVIIAGSAVFGAEDRAAAIRELREAVGD